jgi:nicotinamide-nucleotide amidase
VGITVSAATITLRITASGDTYEAARAATEPTVATIHECLGTLVFGEDDDELENAVVRLLAARNATLGTIEWGTDGLLAHWLAEASAADGPYVGGIVASAAAARECVIDATLAGEEQTEGGRAKPQARGMPETEGAAKTEVGEMAAGCKRLLKTDYVLATGPMPIYDPDGSAVPDFWYALATPNGLSIRSSPYAGNPDILKVLSAKRALNWLRLELL